MGAPIRAGSARMARGGNGADSMGDARRANTAGACELVASASTARGVRMATASLIDRVARFVSRAGKRANSFVISASGEVVAEVPAGDTAAEEIAAACQDYADASGRAVSFLVRALNPERQPVASMSIVVRPAPDDTARERAEITRVIQLLSGHAQELTRLVVASQQAILSAYQSALRDAARRAAEAEARAAAAEEAVAQVEQAPALPPAVEACLAALAARATGSGAPNGSSCTP